MAFFKNIKFGVIFGGLMAAMATGNTAQATPIGLPPGWTQLDFNGVLNPGSMPVTNITVFTTETVPVTLGFSRSSAYIGGPGAIEFWGGAPPQFGLPVSAFAAGVIAGLPSDPVGGPVNHLVIFGHFTPAQLALDYTAIFPSISESTLINDFLNTPLNVQFPIPDVQALYNNALADGIFGGDGSTFQAVAFSTGTVIGQGTINLFPRAQVPEPVTLGLFGSGLAGIMAMRRRRKVKA